MADGAVGELFEGVEQGRSEAEHCGAGLFGLFLVLTHAHGEGRERCVVEIFGIDLAEELAHGTEVFEAFLGLGALDYCHEADELEVFVVGGEVVFDGLWKLFGEESVFLGVAADIDLEAEFERLGGGLLDEWEEFFAVDGLDYFDEGEDFFNFVGLEWTDEMAFVVCKVAEVSLEVGPAVFGEVTDCGIFGEHCFDLLRCSIFNDGTDLHMNSIANYLLQCYCKKTIKGLCFF